MKRIALTLLILAVVVGAGVAYRQGWLASLAGGRQEVADEVQRAASGSAKRAAIKDATPVYVMGRLEPAGGIIDVIAPPGDRLVALSVQEGDHVTQGQEIGHFESRRLREKEVELCQAQLGEAIARRESEVTVAQARLETAKLAEEQLQTLSQLDIDTQTKQLDFLRLAVSQSEKDRDRLTKLADESAELVSKQELEHQQLTVRKAREELQAAEDGLLKFKAVSRFKLRAAAADRAAAEAGLKQAQNIVPVASLTRHKELAEEKLKMTVLVAPVTGTVLRVFTHAGESVGAKPILKVANLERMVCVAEVYDNQVQQIQHGQKAIISSKAFANASNKTPPLEGTVIRHQGNLVASPELKSLDPYASVDRHVIPVRIELNPAASARAADFINLQVEVEFPADDQRVAQSR